METILMIIACFAVVGAYVAWCRRRDLRADREHQAVVTAMSPGPRIRELTTVRPNPMRARKLASGSQPAFPTTTAGGFAHVSTDYGTYTPAEVDVAILGRADTDAETPVSHHDAGSTVDMSHGGFDGGHHGH